MRLLVTAAMCFAPMCLAPALASAETLNIYNWSDYIAEDTLEKFTAETGIDVNYDVYDSNEVLEAKMLAGNSGYDIVVPTTNFVARQIAAGAYQPLDKTKLANLANMDPDIMAAAAGYDEGNAHSIVYMWGTNGIGYNKAMVEERLGGPVTNSWDLVLDPETVAKLADCGVTMLDSPVEVMQLALNYAGLDPRSTTPDDFAKAAEVLTSVRPHIRYFHSSQYINDLANGDVCVSVGYSGDIYQALFRAEEADNGVEIVYLLPAEGAQQWFDVMAIPVDAPNPDAAHQFIDFVMRPEITADITNYVAYANGNAASMDLVDEEIRSDTNIFPDDATSEKLWVSPVYDARLDRTVTRLWTTVTTGQ